MKYNKLLNLDFDNKIMSYKLFNILKMIQSTSSQRKAAKKLNISHTLLNRTLLKAEKDLNQKLVIVTPKGSLLTSFAIDILDEYETFEKRLEPMNGIMVAGGHISSELIREIAIVYGLDDIHILETDYETSINLAKRGMIDILAFDDPVKAYLLDIEPIPLARDSLTLVSGENQSFNTLNDLNNLNFIEIEGSIQRLAWNTLLNHNISFNIKKVVNSYHEALTIIEKEENMHTFINTSMSYNCQYLNNILSEQTRHIISAFNVKNSIFIDNFLNFASHRAQNLTKYYGFEKV